MLGSDAESKNGSKAELQSWIMRRERICDEQQPKTDRQHNREWDSPSEHTRQGDASTHPCRARRRHFRFDGEHEQSCQCEQRDPHQAGRSAEDAEAAHHGAREHGKVEAGDGDEVLNATRGKGARHTPKPRQRSSSRGRCHESGCIQMLARDYAPQRIIDRAAPPSHPRVDGVRAPQRSDQVGAFHLQ